RPRRRLPRRRPPRRGRGAAGARGRDRRALRRGRRADAGGPQLRRVPRPHGGRPRAGGAAPDGRDGGGPGGRAPRAQRVRGPPLRARGGGDGDVRGVTKAAGACVLAGGLAARPRRRTLPIDPDTHAMPTAPRLSLPLALALLVAPALHAQEPPPPPSPIGSGVTPGTVAAAAGDAARPEAAYRPAPFLYYAPVTAVEGTGAVVLATVDATEWPVAVGDRGEVWTNGTTGHHAYGGQLLGTAEV